MLSRKNSNQLAFDLASGKGRELADQAEALISEVVTENELTMDANRILGNKAYDESLFFDSHYIAAEYYFRLNLFLFYDPQCAYRNHAFL
jgi:hypothetical protein